MGSFEKETTEALKIKCPNCGFEDEAVGWAEPTNRCTPAKSHNMTIAVGVRSGT